MVGKEVKGIYNIITQYTHETLTKCSSKSNFEGKMKVNNPQETSGVFKTILLKVWDKWFWKQNHQPFKIAFLILYLLLLLCLIPYFKILFSSHMNYGNNNQTVILIRFFPLWIIHHTAPSVFLFIYSFIHPFKYLSIHWVLCSISVIYLKIDLLKIYTFIILYFQ